MNRYGLIGRTLKHSFSKQYFENKFFTEGIEAAYSLYELETIDDFHNLVTRTEGLAGLNVTIPYKVEVIPYLDELSAEAAAIGAVNCIAIRNGRRIGHNTDIIGIEKSLETLCTDSHMRALVLGTGGASKAVQYALRKHAIPHTVVSRESSRGDITYAKLSRDVISAHHLIINTTPLGMYPNIETAPELDYSAITAEHCIFDLVYNPSPTRFMELCRAHGAKTLGGELMLRVQAEASWDIWNR